MIVIDSHVNTIRKRHNAIDSRANLIRRHVNTIRKRFNAFDAQVNCLPLRGITIRRLVSTLHSRNLSYNAYISIGQQVSQLQEGFLVFQG